MSNKQLVLTPDGLIKAKKDLEDLIVERHAITRRVEDSVKLGDLSENGEYQEAKDAQRFNDDRIAELEGLIKNAVIVKEGSGKKGVINLHSKIVVEDATGKKHNYTIVSINEADPVNGLISNESPLGNAFYGHEEGDSVDVLLPRGTVTYKILKVE